MIPLTHPNLYLNHASCSNKILKEALLGQILISVTGSGLKQINISCFYVQAGWQPNLQLIQAITPTHSHGLFIKNEHDKHNDADLTLLPHTIFFS